METRSQTLPERSLRVVHGEAVAGLFVEFSDRQGNTLGQACFADWDGADVPKVGALFSCRAGSILGTGDSQLTGKVVARKFDRQVDASGTPCVWARVEVVVAPAVVLPRAKRARAFSQN
jgi:hypothetical protein